MPGIDSHQHFWKYDPIEYPWIKPDWPIRHSFLPPDLKPLLDAAGFSACVAVQARQTMEETRWLLDLAKAYPFIAGVVGWVDLRASNLASQLESFGGESKLVGVRHVVQDESDDAFMRRGDFMRGIAQLRAYDLTYDILIFPRQLPAAIELARRFPEQPFVLDHLAKPFIKDRTLDPWRTDLGELAKSGNVFCKISGMVTEAHWGEWKAEDFKPYLETVWKSFGEDRLMIGSDWPVCLLSSDYSRTMRLALDFLDQFGPATRAKVLATNSARFYGLKQR
ncbi:MAG TPA: amidohydrolase family protein [Verrucomicrobiae bacterium]|nr:amidohydrolase family protein [Verrucomicrobiae bacterium]